MATTSTTDSNLVHKRWRTLFFVSTGFFIVALVFMLIFWDGQRKAESKYESEKLRTESLTTERQKLTEKVTTLTQDRAEMQESLSVANQSITAKEIVITRLNQENRTLNTIKGQITLLEKETKAIDQSNTKLQAIQNNMKRTIAAREKQNKTFQSSLK